MTWMRVYGVIKVEKSRSHNLNSWVMFILSHNAKYLKWHLELFSLTFDQIPWMLCATHCLLWHVQSSCNRCKKICICKYHANLWPWPSMHWEGSKGPDKPIWTDRYTFIHLNHQCEDWTWGLNKNKDYSIYIQETSDKGQWYIKTSSIPLFKGEQLNCLPLTI